VSYTAESFGVEVNEQGGECVLIQTWDAGLWKTHKIGEPFADYQLHRGKGYFVKCGKGSSWEWFYVDK
jgi:hypothetical protein